MSSVNITVRVDENIKKDFDEFCENVGMNLSTAVNMFFRATLYENRLPFAVADPKRAARKRMREAFQLAGEDSVKNGTDKMTLEEINAVIEEARRERHLESQ